MMQRSHLIARLATLLLLISDRARATALNVYGLVQTGSAKALITYDLTQKTGGKVAVYEPSSQVRLDPCR